MIHLKARSVLLSFSTATALLILFQNCSPGFQVGDTNLASLESSSDSSNNGDPLSTPQPTSPTTAANGTPSITAPAGVHVVGMNVISKIPITVVDSDSPQKNISFRVRGTTNALSLTADGPEVIANRGINYKPAVDFVGIDTVYVTPVDTEGHIGVEQKFDIRVDQKGIGQMVGVWKKTTCVPNTAPSTIIYNSFESSFNYTEQVFSADCGMPLYALQIGGAHSIGLENVATSSGVTGFEYNVQQKIMRISPLSSFAAIIMNSQKFCGFNNWADKVTKSLDTTGCNGIWSAANIYMYRRVELVNGQPARMYLSDMQSAGNGNTPATRTKGLNLSFFLTKTGSL